jgi:TorA maturation chaperone TorD
VAARRGEHTFLFAREVPVPAQASAYAPSPEMQRARLMSELAALYAAFGFQVSATRPEAPDGICPEIEFVAALLAKEAYALAQGWGSRARLTRRARRDFVGGHLRGWIPAFVERLGRSHRQSFYPAAGALLLALITGEAGTGPDYQGRGEPRVTPGALGIYA